ncbi:death-associated inhibitor of apoptosis 2 [Plutella xylostella]|uniref:death-associated inhibitor of apoptosis 2 n=1 Tax=Plutella xylostella TaxID=51655 RepID=UPI002032D713|nr:death-associated inhibitor of apoptosis 2 [Plutella xylostella]
MNYEANRLNTFSNWPSSAVVDPIRIAKAGFFYTGQGVEVQCFSCGGKISEWNYGDQAMGRHRRLDPDCPFVVDPQASGNVALVLDQRCPEPTSSRERPSNPLSPMDIVHDYGVTEEDEMYKCDALRLLSFVNWDDSSVSREALVRAGFYHAGGGRLRCAWCGGELASMRRLGALGDPLDVHLRYFPGCSHADRLSAEDAAARARPMTPPPLVPPRPRRSAEETESDDPNSPTYRNKQPQSEGAIHNQRVLSGSGTWRSLGVVGGAGGARHPNKGSIASRLATYTTWPVDRTQTPQDMAEAGFFYTGAEDQVRCFYCDGGLGKWEAGDAPWREHARWFPHCGFLVLVKGQDFVNSCKVKQSSKSIPSDSVMSARRVTGQSGGHSVTESQIAEQMESAIASAALGAGLDAARVRRAIVRRLRYSGIPFTSSEALIDAVLDEQLNEEAWSVTPPATLYARELLIDTIRRYNTSSQPSWESRPHSRASPPASPRSLTPERRPRAPSPRAAPSSVDGRAANSLAANINSTSVQPDGASSPSPEAKPVSLEEENRQLREARLCKVCMDDEVSVVFLPCGHLVSCAACGAGLGACPLCRGKVHALVRAYLA